MIDIKHVSKIYQLDTGEFRALDDVSLTIRKGEFVSIVGPSGCGKSTLMQVLGLLDRPTKGEIIINDQKISVLNDDQLSHIRSQVVGFVFQQFNLITKMTVLENVLLPTLYARKKLDFVPKDRAVELLTRFGIGTKLNVRPNRISGGQQQRTAIARALIMHPEIILADEPTGNLDSKTGIEILKLLTDLNRDMGVTIVIVTHDPSIAKQTKRQVHMRDGKII